MRTLPQPSTRYTASAPRRGAAAVLGPALLFLVGCRGGEATHPPQAAQPERPAPSAPWPPTRPTLLTASPRQTDLGVLSQGGRKELTFTLHNAGTSPVEITELKTSCECLTLTLPKKVVAPGETVSATAKVDFADDPKYVGRLELEGTGKAAAPGPDAFVIHVRVEVREAAPAGPP